MADFKRGRQFSFRIKIGSVLVPVNCKTTASLSLSNEGVVVQNDCTDDYGQALDGGTKSGSFTFDADLDFASLGVASVSWFDLVPLLGTVQEFAWGDTTAGQKYILFDGRLDNLDLTGSTNEQISFSGTVNLSGAPVIMTSTT
jgi:hypothetical protein